MAWQNRFERLLKAMSQGEPPKARGGTRNESNARALETNAEGKKAGD
jgi:hypothetical protein